MNSKKSNTGAKRTFLKIDSTNAKKKKECPGCKCENFEINTNLPKIVNSKFYEITYDIDIQIMRCNDCGLYFKSHSVDHDVDKVIYASFNINKGKRWAKKIPKRFINELEIVNDCDRVLEIGPGETPVSAYFSKPNFYSSEMDPQHIPNDPSPEKRQFQGLIDKDISEVIDERFDAILAFDLFEHVEDVEKMFENLYTLLRPGGLVVFETGNCQSRPASVLKGNWKYYNIPEHRVFFGKETVLSMSRRNNFTPVKISYTRHKSVRSMTGFIRKSLATLKYLSFKRNLFSNDNNSLFIGPEFPFFKDHMLCILRKQS